MGSYGSDQATFVWLLAWWPHAIEHGVHPLLIDLVHAPDGWNLAWTSAIPGPALLAWPLTAVFGPIPAYDVLAVAAPALAAWCTCLLCRELGTGGWAAAAGGLVFGFGSYEAAETLNHLNLALVFTLPLAALVVARYLRGRALRRLVRRPARALRRRHLRDVPRDALLGHDRRRRRPGRRTGRHARERAGAPLPLPAAGGAGLWHRPARGLAVPLVPARAFRSARGQRPRLRARPRQPDRADPRDGDPARLRARPGRAARRPEPDRAGRVHRPRAARWWRASPCGSGAGSRSPGCSR